MCDPRHERNARMLELRSGMLGTAREMSRHGEQPGQGWAESAVELQAEARPAQLDFQDWVRSIASVPAPASIPSRPPAASTWKKLRLALTLSLAVSAK